MILKTYLCHWTYDWKKIFNLHQNAVFLWNKILIQYGGFKMTAENFDTLKNVVHTQNSFSLKWLWLKLYWGGGDFIASLYKQ